MTLTRLLAAWAIMTISAAASAYEPPLADLHVALDGNDSNPGTAKAPLATIARARDLLRPRIAAGLDADVLVLIRGGTYRLEQPLVFGPDDSGTDRHTITYAAWPGEKVMLSGGRKISGWRHGQGQIWTVELPAVKAGQWFFRQLFVGGRRAVRARTPNGPEWWKLRPQKNSDANDATVTLGVDHPIQAWKNVSDVELIWINNNDGTRKRLGHVNEADSTCTLPPPHMWPHGMPGEYNISFPSGAFSCYFENAVEMLDRPGEWYLDRSTGTLSYWPREGEDLTRAEVVAPVVQKSLLCVAGTPMRPVRNLRLKGIHVAHVDRPLPPYGFAAQFGCLEYLEQPAPEPSKKYRWIDAAVSFQHARGCEFRDGGIAHVGGIGLSLLNGCAGDVIEGNEISDLGGGGITAGAIRNRDTWKWADALAPDDHKGYRIANNHIHDCGLDYFGAIGIFMGLTQEAVVAHNLIHDVAYSGIVLSGNEAPGPPFAKNNTVEYNHIYDVMKVAVDGAGIYVSFPQADRGAAIRGNWIHDLRRNPANPRDAGPWSAAGIYLDGVRPELGCRGYRFEKNVVYRTENPLFFCQCSANGNTWQDNVFEKDTPPKQRLEAIASEAGLEPAYRWKLTGKP
jgi:Right handed beta helix region